MSRGNNKGSGHHRKTGDWVALARGRANKKREASDRVRCPHGGPHWVASRSFLGHLTTCQAGLTRSA